MEKLLPENSKVFFEPGILSPKSLIGPWENVLKNHFGAENVHCFDQRVYDHLSVGENQKIQGLIRAAMGIEGRLRKLYWMPLFLENKRQDVRQMIKDTFGELHLLDEKKQHAQEVIQAHDGPAYLLGDSMGGVILDKIAAELTAKKEAKHIRQLVTINSPHGMNRFGVKAARDRLTQAPDHEVPTTTFGGKFDFVVTNAEAHKPSSHKKEALVTHWGLWGNKQYQQQVLSVINNPAYLAMPSDQDTTQPSVSNLLPASG